MKRTMIVCLSALAIWTILAVIEDIYDVTLVPSVPIQAG